MVQFGAQRFLILMKLNSLIFSFVDCAFDLIANQSGQLSVREGFNFIIYLLFIHCTWISSFLGSFVENAVLSPLIISALLSKMIYHM